MKLGLKIITLLSILCIIGFRIIAQDSPHVTFENVRTLPKDGLWLEIYDLMKKENFAQAEHKFDSIQRVYFKNKNYNDYLFLANEYSYWLFIIKRDKQLGAEVSEKALNTVLELYDKSNIEILLMYYNLGLLNYDYKVRLYWYERFLKECPEDQLLKLRVNIHAGCARFAYNLGEFELAWVHWDECKEHLNDFRAPSDYYIKIAETLYQADENITIALLEKSYYYMQQDSSFDFTEYLVLENLASLYYTIGNYEKAVYYGKEACLTFENNKEAILSIIGRIEMTTNIILIKAYINLHQNDLAQAQLNKLKANMESSKSPEKISIQVKRLKSKILFQEEKYDSSMFYITDALDNAKKLYLNTDFIYENITDDTFAETYKDQGNIYINQKHYAQAINSYENAIKVMSIKYYKNLNDSLLLLPPEKLSPLKLESIINLLNQIVDSYNKMYKESQDKEILFKTIELCNYTNQVAITQFRTLINEKSVLETTEKMKTTNSYALYAAYELSKTDSSYIDSAFIYSDMARSFNLNYLKKLKHHTVSSTEDSLMSAISQASIELANCNNSSQDDQYLSLQLELLKTKMILRKKMQRETENIDISIPFKKLKDSITNKDALLKYFIDDNVIYALCYTSNGSSVKLINFPNLQKEINKLKYHIKSGDNSSDIQYEFYNKLIAPFSNNLKGINNLTIISDELMNEIPFELFIDSNNKMLVENFTIKYRYSAKDLDFNKTDEYSSLLAVAPGFEKNSNFLAQNVTRSAIDSLDIFSKREFSSQLNPIVYSLEEVDEIDSLQKKHKVITTIMKGNTATESNFKQEVNKFNIIHIATHGISRSEYESGLFFTQTDSNKDDGFLRLPELYQLNLTCNLVVLSACKTGTGKIIEGEGVMALPRGFIYAGVPNIIASLWKVHDQKTKDLMVAFYTHLLDDKVSYAEALRLAKLDCIEKGFLPLDWAGFILIGK